MHPETVERDRPGQRPLIVADEIDPGGSGLDRGRNLARRKPDRPTGEGDQAFDPFRIVGCQITPGRGQRGQRTGYRQRSRCGGSNQAAGIGAAIDKCAGFGMGAIDCRRKHPTSQHAVVANPALQRGRLVHPFERPRQAAQRARSARRSQQHGVEPRIAAAFGLSELAAKGQRALGPVLAETPGPGGVEPEIA